MLLPEFLYERFLRAKGRPPYPRGFLTQGSATAATATYFTITLPDDSDFLMLNALLWGQVTGETFSMVDWVMQIAGQNTINLFYSTKLTAAKEEFHFPNPLYFPRGTVLRVASTKSAGVANATWGLDLYGYFLPPMDL